VLSNKTRRVEVLTLDDIPVPKTAKKNWFCIVFGIFSNFFFSEN
jgi:hypothetical protein